MLKDSKMSFKEKTNIDNITFAELDRLIENWIYETGELQCQFINQSDELRSISKQHIINDMKCEAINNRLNCMKCSYNYFEYVMRTCQEYHTKFEELVSIMEHNISDLYRNTIPKDKIRTKIYSNVEKIDDMLNTNQRLSDDLTMGIIKSDREAIKDPCELIARILMRQLYNLEMIEVRIQQMFNQVCVVNCQMAQLRQARKSRCGF